MLKKRKQKDLIEIVNEIGEDIDSILDERKTERYLEGIVLTYSLIENILKYTVFLKRSWDQNCSDVDNDLPLEKISEHTEKIHKECSKYNFYKSLENAHELGLIDDKLQSMINEIREERNDMVHQFWLYAHRKNPHVLEKKLKKIVRISKKTIKPFVKLSREIGIDEIFDVSVFFRTNQ